MWAPQPSGAEASRCCLLFLPLAALPPPFSYTHRPGRSGAHEPAGSGVDFPTPRNSFVWRLLKMGSRARTRGERPAPTAAWLPGRPRAAYPRPRPTYPIPGPPNPPALYPRPTYPIPGPPTPHPPAGLPLSHTVVATYTRILHGTRPPKALSLPDLPRSIVS